PKPSARRHRKVRIGNTESFLVTRSKQETGGSGSPRNPIRQKKAGESSNRPLRLSCPLPAKWPLQRPCPRLLVPASLLNRAPQQPPVPRFLPAAPKPVPLALRIRLPVRSPASPAALPAAAPAA